MFATARNNVDVEKLKNLNFDTYQLDLSSSESIQRAISASDYQHSYEQMIKHLNTDKLAAYTLLAKAILKYIIHALETKNAKIHY
ncbi:hypothetical protein [Candidatus Ruthia endofausta]|uniref:hypothetical protein n=1 Tax=Candidatus Ruthia endofausta TaxID=2738852 RepID=UPI001FE42F3A|nr:hypothetical protein [Candidatus Ruthia endofausta]